MKRKSLLTICAVIAVVLLLMTACEKSVDSNQTEVRTIQIDGASMEPTYHAGQTVDVLPLSGKPAQGDVIYIKKGEEYSKPLVKRVIAAGGQELKIDFDNNEIYVDGKKLDEPYIQGVTVRGDLPDEEINGVIPDGKLFVLGDNRSISLDSRYINVGLIDENDVVGLIAEPEK